MAGGATGRTFTPEHLVYRSITYGEWGVLVRTHPTAGRWRRACLSAKLIEPSREPSNIAEIFAMHISKRRIPDSGPSTDRAVLPNRLQDENVAARLLTAILETAADAIVVIDDHGVIGTFNRAAEVIFGYQRDEVIGQNVSVLMPRPYADRHDAYIANYLRTGHARIIGIGREAVGRRKDGTAFPIEIAVSEVADCGRRTFTGIVRDISERRRLEAEILQVSEREQQRIGHELHDGLCQELAGIAFSVQSLLKKATAAESIDPAELAGITSLLQEAVRHARGLAHGLYPVDPQPDGLASALGQLAADTSELFHVHCEFHAVEPLGVPDAVAATHLYRIAQDAVPDAARRGKADQIQIKLAHPARSILLTVSDNGLGLLTHGRYKQGMVPSLMRHRANVIGALLQINPGPAGRGVQVTCELKSDT